jgi:hypothetical protein
MEVRKMNTEKRVPLTRVEKFWDIFGLVVILVVLALLVSGIESRAGDVMCYIGGAIALALTVHDFKHGRVPDKDGEKSRSVFDNVSFDSLDPYDPFSIAYKSPFDD